MESIDWVYIVLGLTGTVAIIGALVWWYNNHEENKKGKKQ